MTPSRDPDSKHPPAPDAAATAGRDGSSPSEDTLSVSPVQGPSEGSTAHAQSLAFSAGDVLAERYRVVRFIAQGAMGTVYEAEDLRLRERVALKTIRPEIAEDAKAARAARRNAKAAQAAATAS